MVDITVGTRVDTSGFYEGVGPLADVKIRCKYTCECGEYPVIVISKGVFQGFLKTQADFVEGAFGHVSPAANAEK